MENLKQRNDNGLRGWMGQIDRVSRQVNAVLLVMAIGLVVLDLTYVFAFDVRDALPSPARVSTDRSLVSKAAMPPAGQSVAAVTPTGTGAMATGR